MNKLEKLKQEMVVAKQVYDEFQNKFSRSLTEDELKQSEQMATFGFPCVVEEPKMLELTLDNVEEMKRLESKMKETYLTYVKELTKNNI